MRAVTDARRSVGALGERHAEAHVVRAGYRVLERNYRTRAGELDLVLLARGCLVFCEVRARVGGAPGEPGGSLDSVGPDKRRRLRRMARAWLSERDVPPRSDAGEIRFDVIGLTLTRSGALVELEHVEGAF